MNTGERKENALIERQNLLKIAEYAIKEMINVSIEETNIIEGEAFQVVQLLAILDNIFLHGIQKSNRQCWKMIIECAKINNDFKDSVDNIVNLPNVRTNLGRLRAWIRLTLMQKSFGDFYSKLIENKYFLNQYYENTAFMFNEEAQILAGLLLSLNFTDFNFCLKEINLDDIKITIDISRYMKIASLETPLINSDSYNLNSHNGSFDQDNISIGSSKDSKFTDVLDQKNYLQEINKNHSNLIADLKDKYNTSKRDCDILKREISEMSHKNLELETANSLLIANFEKPRHCSKTDYLSLSNNHAGTNTESLTDQLSISCNKNATNPISTSELLCEYSNLANNQTQSDNYDEVKSLKNEIEMYKKVINDAKQELLEEKANKLKFEHQYNVANKRKNELEGMYRTLEKLEKQKSDLNTDMKRQLDDLKAINSEMYSKIENYEGSLKHKNELVTRMEHKNRSVTSALKEMEERYEKLQNYQSSTEDIFGKMEREINKKDQIICQLENDLKLEREMKVTLQHQIQKDKLEFGRKLKEITRAEDILKNNEYLHKRNEELVKVRKEHEQSLFELGLKLKEATLQTDDLKDTFMPYLLDSKWLKDDEVTDCPVCHIIFNTIVRKHHCRNCGGIFCQECSKYRANMSFSLKPVRVCFQCYDILINKSNAVEEINNSLDSINKT